MLSKAATGALEGLILDGAPYARAGLMLTDLSPAGAGPQLPMFTTAHEEKRIGPLFGDIMDRFGTGAIGLGRAGMAEAPDWGMKRLAMSPRYTTEWLSCRSSKPADTSHCHHSTVAAWRNFSAKSASPI